MVGQTQFFFLVNHFSQTRKKVDLWYKTIFFSGQPLFLNQISPNRFLLPDFSNQISKNCRNRGRRIKGWVGIFVLLCVSATSLADTNSHARRISQRSFSNPCHLKLLSSKVIFYKSCGKLRRFLLSKVSTRISGLSHSVRPGEEKYGNSFLLQCSVVL